MVIFFKDTEDFSEVLDFVDLTLLIYALISI